ncbi:ash family protein [Rodentibacter pneumotropicus]|uniref:ash family protein n=1 Tax=Rodentibacter pneumotropicus TaxID=758 RepID=UPI0015C3F1DE|nr:ash family protein [Rodentibacter pneumotropicus]
MANSNTPLNRVIFVCNTRTPQTMAGFVSCNQKPIILSMVERNGQPLAVGCVPLVAVSHPVTFYRQTVRSLAVVPKFN